MGSASVADVGSGVNVLKGESSGYVGTWAMADNGRILIINADGTAMTPEMGNWSENRFKWHSEGNRIVFDGWVINKGFGFGFGFGEVDGNQIRLCDEAGITGHEQTWFRSRN